MPHSSTNPKRMVLWAFGCSLSSLVWLFVWFAGVSVLACSGSVPGTESGQETVADSGTDSETIIEPITTETFDGSVSHDSSPDDSLVDISHPVDSSRESDPVVSLGRWEEGTDLPSAIQEIAVVALQGEIYVLGGIKTDLSTTDQVWAYHPDRKQWRKIASMPKAMHHVNAVVWQDNIYVVGGLNATFREMNDVFAYNPKHDQWITKKPLPEGRVRGASVLGVIDNKIYIAGGLRRRAVIDFDAYDPQTETWQKKADLPVPLDHLAGGVIQGKFYIAGGRDTDIGALHNKSYVYTPNTDSWSPIPPMPTPRGGVAAAVHLGKFYVFGGEGNPAPGTNGVFPQSEVYDPETNQWHRLRPMPLPIHGTGAASLGDRIYIPAGANRQAYGAIADHAVFLP